MAKIEVVSAVTCGETRCDDTILFTEPVCYMEQLPCCLFEDIMTLARNGLLSMPEVNIQDVLVVF